MHSVCPHDCPSCCSLEVTVVDGHIGAVTGTPGHPFTQGIICGKVREYAERVHSPLRVLTPLRRIGAKGEGRFAPTTWDAAITEIAARWRAIAREHGGEAILPFSYAGSMGQIQYWAGHPLFHALGASRLDRTICVTTAYAGWRATVGQVTGNDSEQMVGADLVVLWGVNAAYSTINVMTLVKQARERGAYVVVIDPYRTATALQADEHLMVRPGTDAALALAVMHVLVTEGLVDREYIERATLGFPELADHVKRYAPDEMAPIVGLPAETIVRFARRYGATPRTFIRAGIGLSRHDNGGMTCRTLACLPALTGAYADPHGGALLSSGGAFELDFGAFERADLMPAPTRVINMIQLGRALTDPALAPPVKALYVYSSNPAAVCPHQTLVLRGLAREDLFTVVHEQVLTDTAHYADFVLPATTSMEHLDVYRSFGQFYLQLAEPVIPPVGEARSNWDVCAALAGALGLGGAAAPYARGPEAAVRAALAGGAPAVRAVTWERLRAEKSVRLELPRPYLPFADGAPTPSGKVEFLSASLARAGLPALPTWTPLREGPQQGDVRRYPLQCIVPPNRFFLNSSFSQSERLRRRQGTPTVMLSPDDAAARGITDGEVVRVASARGEAPFTARVTDATRSGVVVIEGIWWHRFHPGGRGVNVLTDDRVADMGGGPALHSNLVEVSRA
ncbi:MAG TPA: molybdopterin oxidoreductase family protein [Methylomirabilota bacterium]|nr:molybdopterin oxidoreductase family protein [Methylomirabilota bacterium]